MKNKAVYILGAGFSKEAKAPSQEELVKKIFETHKLDHTVLGNEKVTAFKKFLTETLNISEPLQETIPLEDIFTPLDKCIIENLSFRDLNVEELKKKRELVYELIGKTLQYLLRETNKCYADDFGKHLVELCSLRKNHKYREIDKVSVISTNWDILMDNAIYNYIIEKEYYAVVDYCCYISSYRKEDTTVKPGLEILGNEGFNVKLLKLHGSLNWLQCPRCLRLYVEFNDKIAMNQFSEHSKPTCRHCDGNFGAYLSHRLVSNLIMPTFLKDLTNPQYKIIWQNAGIELSEAERIIFIGYSLPYSDFEMRQLLSRMVRNDALIEVVDYARDEDGKEITKCLTRFNELKERYKIFFGGRKINFYDQGAKHYIANNLS